MCAAKLFSKIGILIILAGILSATFSINILRRYLLGLLLEICWKHCKRSTLCYKIGKLIWKRLKHVTIIYRCENIEID